MKSTWRQDKSTWTTIHYAVDFIDPFVFDPNVPVFKKTDPVPVASWWSPNVWIMAHAIWPMLLQSAYTFVFGHNLSAPAAFVLYMLAWTTNAVRLAYMLRRVTDQTGFFDGEHKRDEMPDAGIGRAVLSVALTLSVRPFYTVLLAYRSNVGVSVSIWLPVELFLYAIVLDFWFYVYHRSCHESHDLWKYHRTHHLTKRPNAFLGAYADAEQEMLEIAIIPILTFTILKLLGLPMGFYDWWICHQFVIFSEGFGHSGLRLWASTPGTASPILALFGCELVIEDHDLHHRHGWRKSCNYGKQTRLWDRVFGTHGRRVEGDKTNVDFSKKIYFPVL